MATEEKFGIENDDAEKVPTVVTEGTDCDKRDSAMDDGTNLNIVQSSVTSSLKKDTVLNKGESAVTNVQKVVTDSNGKKSPLSDAARTLSSDRDVTEFVKVKGSDKHVAGLGTNFAESQTKTISANKQSKSHQMTDSPSEVNKTHIKHVQVSSSSHSQNTSQVVPVVNVLRKSGDSSPVVSSGEFLKISNTDSLSSNASSISRIAKSIKLEPLFYAEDNPLDFSSKSLQNEDMKEKSTLNIDDDDKSCPLDYTLNTLNKVELTQKSFSREDSTKNSCDTKKSHDYSTCKSCDSTKDSQIGSCDVSLNELKPSPSGSFSSRFSEFNKNVLLDSSKIFNSTNSLLKDTTDLLKNTSSLLYSDTSELLDNTRTFLDQSEEVKSDNVDVGQSLILDSGIDDVTYSSAEEYKNRHKIGSRRSSENVLTYNNPVIQPYLPGSPEKMTAKNLGKRKFCVDEIAEHLAKKRAVVSLGERVKGTQCSPNKGDKSYSSFSSEESESPLKGEKSKSSPLLVKKENTSVSTKKDQNSSSKNEEKNKSPKAKKKTVRSPKKLEILPMPSRRIKREASLNASAMVNIMYEKDNVSPRSRKLSTSSSSSNRKLSTSSSSSNRKLSTSSCFSNKTQNKSNQSKSNSGKISRSVSSESLSNSSVIVKKRSKSLGRESPGKNKKVVNESGNKIKPKSKSTSCIDSKRKKQENKSLKNMSKDLPEKKFKSTKQIKDGSKKTKEKLASEKDQKAKKRKSSSDVSEGKTKKEKVDGKKSARTHVGEKPKGGEKVDAPTCNQCCKHTCPTGRSYWNVKEDGQTVKDEEKISDTSSNLPMDVPKSYPAVPTVQLMEGSPYVVPHGHIGACPACAQGGGSLIPTTHSYTLGGIGSLSQMMPYHQPYGGGYPVPFPPPSGTTSLPHCGCPTCYSASGVYYPQTSTPIAHQQLPHEPCMVPHPVHMTSEESEFIDVVGFDSDNDDKVSEVETLSPPVIIEKVRKKSLSKKEPVKKKNLSELKKKAKTKLTKIKTKKLKKTKKTKDKKKLKKKKIKQKVIKKPQYRKSVSKHGWEFDGNPEKRKIMCHSVGAMVERSCYPSIRHIDGDIINVRDCVLLRSGPRKSDIPYVAKVKAFWEDPLSKEMMMSILWYYQPEHTEGGRKPHHLMCELFASKHKDENCVACIEDKGYVLTYGEYCRFLAEQRRTETLFPPRNIVVPEPSEEYPARSKLPNTGVDPNTVYVCRQVYDFKLKRILKNPS